VSREERGNKETEVEEEALKAIRLKFRRNAIRPCIIQRWLNVWDALRLLPRAEGIRAVDSAAISAIGTK